MSSPGEIPEETIAGRAGPPASERLEQLAIRLADEFLARARPQVSVVAEDDLEQLRAAAMHLRDLNSPGVSRSSRQVAYALVASAFNQAVARHRDGG